MRVLIVSNLWPPDALGGAEMHAHELAARLDEAGHEVGVVATVDAVDAVARVPAWPYSVRNWSEATRAGRLAFHIRDQFDPVTATVLTKAIWRFRPDVVHTHALAGMSVAALLAPRWCGVAHVHTIHDYWLLCQRSTMVDRRDNLCVEHCRSCRAISAARLGVLRHRPADVVLAVSEAVAAEHRAAGVRNVRVVYNPTPARSPRARLDGSPVRFGYLGQLVPIKGVRTLLGAARLRPTGSEVVVAGDGPLGDEVRAAGDVRYVGWLDRAGKADFFAEIDCLVVPSEWRDPAPLVVREAAANGVAVIGADIGGIPELIPSSCRELLFPAGDVAQLADRMASFAANPPRFVAIVTGPTWEEHVAEVVAAYEEARKATEH